MTSSFRIFKFPLQHLLEYHEFDEAQSDLAGLQVQLAMAKGCHRHIRGGADWAFLNNLLQCARLLEMDNSALEPLAAILENDKALWESTNITRLNWRNEHGALQRLEGIFERLYDGHLHSESTAVAVAKNRSTAGARFLLKYREVERLFFERHIREVRVRLLDNPGDASSRIQFDDPEDL